MENIDNEQKLDKILAEFNCQKENCDECGSKIRELLKELLKISGIKFHAITYRLKDEESLRKKIRKKGYKYDSLKDITDIIGIRVITYYIDEVNEVAKLIEKNFDIDEENTIDKGKALEIDKFGYLSLHYIAELKEERVKFPEYGCCKGHKVEIQIRTILQHAWAEIQHDLEYKNDDETPRDARRNFYRLAGLLETVDKEFMDTRNLITQYAKDINNRIENEEETVFIDRISLEAYVKNDPEYSEIIDCIAKEKNITLYDDEASYGRYIEYLNYANYKTINQVKEDVRTKADKLYEVSKKILKGITDNIPRIVLLLYLCYVKFAEKNSIEEFLKFFEKYKFRSADAKRFATNIIDVCKEEK